MGRVFYHIHYSGGKSDRFKTEPDSSESGLPRSDQNRYSGVLVCRGGDGKKSELEKLIINQSLDWVNKALSDLYVVFNERRSRDGAVIERAIIVKLSYVFAF